jgi:hypothetical protein
MTNGTHRDEDNEIKTESTVEPIDTARSEGNKKSHYQLIHATPYTGAVTSHGSCRASFADDSSADDEAIALIDTQQEEKPWRVRHLAMLSRAQGDSHDTVRQKVSHALMSLARQPDDADSASMLDGLLQEDPRASEITRTMVMLSPDTMDYAEASLGIAAVHGATKDACKAAQWALLQLINDGTCEGQCAMTAITRMGFIRSRHDMHDATLAFFNRHSRQRSSPHWEATTLMLGSLSHHLGEPQLVQHLHESLQRSHPASAQRAAKHHEPNEEFFEKRTLMAALGNSGQSGLVPTLESYSTHPDVFVQRAAVTALRSIKSDHAAAAHRRIGGSLDSHNMVRRLACEHLHSIKDAHASKCSASIERDHAQHMADNRHRIHPALADLLQQGDGVGAIITDVLKELKLPFSLNITHFSNKRWGTKMGDRDSQSGLSAGLASQLTAVVDETGLNCIVQLVIGGGKGDATEGDVSFMSVMNEIQMCLVDNADISAFVDATGDLSANVFNNDLNIIRGQFVGAASLLPLPIPEKKADGTMQKWYEALDDNYRLMLDLTLLNMVIPIFKVGALVKDFRTQNTLEGAAPHPDSDGDTEDEDSGRGYGMEAAALVQTSASARNIAIGSDSGATPIQTVTDSLKASSCTAASLPEAQEEVWSERWMLGKLSVVIIPGVLYFNIEFAVNAGLNAGYNFAPCGGLFDLSIYGTAAAIPFANLNVKASVDLDFFIAKAGVVVDMVIMDTRIIGSAAVGCSLRDIGGIKGDVTLRLVIVPFKMNIYMYFQFLWFRFEMPLLVVEVGGIDLTLLRFVIEPKEKPKAAATDELLALPSPSGNTVQLTTVQQKQSDDVMAALKATETPYDLPAYLLAEKVNRPPVSLLGMKDYQLCHTAEDCQNGYCAKTSEEGTLGGETHYCRPVTGFKLDFPCWYESDCRLEQNEFCYHARSARAVCAAMQEDYATCTKNLHCQSGTCALQFGTECVDEDDNCRCRPTAGFKSGTASASALDCASREVQSRSGISYCANTATAGAVQDAELFDLEES